MNYCYLVAQVDRDRKEDLGLADSGDCAGAGPHAQHADEVVAS